jgi:hypothetical protein
MLRLIENKPRRQRGKSPSVKSLLVLATLLFASAAVLYPLVDTGRLPTVHRSTSHDKPGFAWLPRFGGDVDCAGGRGNGPNFAYGPVVVAPGDPHGLDQDGDGIGCE